MQARGENSLPQRILSGPGRSEKIEKLVLERLPEARGVPQVPQVPQGSGEVLPEAPEARVPPLFLPPREFPFIFPWEIL